MKVLLVYGVFVALLFLLPRMDKRARLWLCSHGYHDCSGDSCGHLHWGECVCRYCGERYNP